jgi:hypothetical protein
MGENSSNVVTLIAAYIYTCIHMYIHNVIREHSIQNPIFFCSCFIHQQRIIFASSRIFKPFVKGGSTDR